MLVINEILKQYADCSKLSIKDITGSYSAGNPDGWNGGGNPNVTDVTSVYISGTYRPYPAASPAQTIVSTELMPSPNVLPYMLWQEFVLTPSLLGFNTTNFGDGIYILTLTVNTSSASVPFISASGNFNIGDVITDTTNHKVVGTIVSVTQSAGAGTMILTNTGGNIVTVTDGLSNGTVTAVAGTASPTYTNGVYTCDFQSLVTCNVDCCLGKKLAALVLNNNCERKKVEAVFEGIFEPLMIAKAQAGCTQNNAALNSLAVAENNCLGCGC